MAIQLHLQNESDLKQAIDDLIGAIENGDLVTVDSSSIDKIEFVFEGKGFSSSFPTSVAAAILRFQDTIHRVYSLQKYGDYKRLTREEKASLELTIVVKPGSSLVSFTLQDIWKVFQSMTSGDLLTAIGIVSIAATAILVGVPLIKGHFQTRQKEIESRQAIARTEEQKHLYDVFGKAIETATDASVGVGRRLLDAAPERLKINGTEIQLDDLREATKVDRPRYETIRSVVRGSFQIVSADFDHDEIDVRSIADAKLYQNVACQFSEIPQQDAELMRNATEKTPFEMEIVIETKAGKLIGAFLTRSQQT